MPSFFGGVGNALGAGLGGGAASLGLGLLGGFLGGGPQLPPELKKLYRFQSSIADQLRRYSQGVPMSDPGEQAALAQQRAFLGAEQNNAKNTLFAGLPTQARATAGGQADQLGTLASRQVSQNMALDTNHFLASLANRKNALLQASQVGTAALGAAGAQRYDLGAGLPEMFGNLAQVMSYAHERNKGAPNNNTGGQPQTAPPGTSFSGFGPVPTSYTPGYQMPTPLQWPAPQAWGG